MKIEKIICDKCGVEITEAKPDRVQLLRYVEKQEGRFTKKYYKPIVGLHVCEKCMKKLFPCMGRGETEACE